MNTYMYFVTEMTRAGLKTAKVTYLTATSGEMLFSPVTSRIMIKGQMKYVCLRGE